MTADGNVKSNTKGLGQVQLGFVMGLDPISAVVTSSQFARNTQEPDYFLSPTKYAKWVLIPTSTPIVISTHVKQCIRAKSIQIELF